MSLVARRLIRATCVRPCLSWTTIINLACLLVLIPLAELHSQTSTTSPVSVPPQQEFWTTERQSAVIFVRAFAAAADTEPSERGTGFFVSRGGYFVTAEHLVSGATRVQISLDGTGGPWIDFSPIGTMSLGWDLALLKAPERAAGFPMLPLGCPETVRREAQLRFAGFPFGRGFDQRRAEVSSNEGLVGGLQLDANAAGGFSGGPVLDASGRVVAVISAGVTRTPGFLQVVPLSRARSRLGDIGVFIPKPEECSPVGPFGPDAALDVKLQVRVNVFKNTPPPSPEEITVEIADNALVPDWSSNTVVRMQQVGGWELSCRKGADLLLRASIPGQKDIVGPIAQRRCGDSKATEIWIGERKAVIDNLLNNEVQPLLNRIGQLVGSRDGLCSENHANYGDPAWSLDRRAPLVRDSYSDATRLLREAIDVTWGFPQLGQYRARALSDLALLYVRARKPCEAMGMISQEIYNLDQTQPLSDTHAFRYRPILVGSLLDAMVRCATGERDNLPDAINLLVELAELQKHNRLPAVGSLGNWIVKLRSAQNALFGILGGNIASQIADNIRKDEDLWEKWDALFETLSAPSCQPQPQKEERNNAPLRFDILRSVKASINLQRIGKCAWPVSVQTVANSG